jgi:hypothetical protein
MANSKTPAREALHRIVADSKGIPVSEAITALLDGKGPDGKARSRERVSRRDPARAGRPRQAGRAREPARHACRSEGARMTGQFTIEQADAITRDRARGPAPWIRARR